jgi:hypothetical protein
MPLKVVPSCPNEQLLSLRFPPMSDVKVHLPASDAPAAMAEVPERSRKSDTAW